MKFLIESDSNCFIIEVALLRVNKGHFSNPAAVSLSSKLFRTFGKHRAKF